MRRIFSMVLAALFVLALVSCTQYVSFPLPDHGFGNSQSGEINEVETTKEFAREFSLIRAFQDAMNGEEGVSFDETASTQSMKKGAQVTKRLSFSGYKQGEYVVEDGTAVFSFEELESDDTVCSVKAEGLVIQQNGKEIISNLVIDIDNAKTKNVLLVEESDGGYSLSVPFPASDLGMETPPGAKYLVDGTEFIYAETAEDIEFGAEGKDPLEVIGSINLRQLIEPFSGDEYITESEGIRQTSLVYEVDNNRRITFSLVFSLDSYKLGNVLVTGDIMMECDNDVTKTYKLSTPSYLLVRAEGETAYSRLKINEITGEINCNTSVYYGALKFASTDIGAVNTLSCTLDGKDYSKDDVYGTGTLDNPYRIYTADMLRLHFVNDEETAAGKHAKLMASIDFGGYEWVPTERYDASLDGNNMTISNLVIRGTKTSLTEELGPEGRIENLTLDAVTFLHTSSNQGIALIGELYGTVQNVHVLDSCKIEVRNDAPGHIGAIASEMYSGLISGSTNAMDIEDGNYIGGITGVIWGGEIRECTNTGNLVAEDAQIGGIAGNAFADEDILIQGCVNKGKIQSGSYDSVGGIAGEISVDSDTAATILNCTNYGDVINTDESKRDGIAGRNYGASIEGCENYGNV